MFNWPLFVALVLVCLPGIVVVVPGAVSTMLANQLPAAGLLSSRRGLVLAAVLQSIVYVAIAAAVGVRLAPRLGLAAPILEAALAGRPFLGALQALAGPTVVVSVLGALLFLAAYYQFFIPRLDRESVVIIERVRAQVGPLGRMVYGGIVEEVLHRWGLMTLFAWLGTRLTGDLTATVMWAAIVLSGLLFGLGHLPSYLGAGVRRTNLFLLMTIALNLEASLVFGWLFWHYGLVAAILAHMILHLIWLPIDRRVKYGGIAVRTGST